MVNPSKIVRKTVIESLRTATGLTVVENNIPIDKNTPKSWIVLSGQTKQKTAVSKSCYDWDCGLVLEIFTEQPKGFSSGLTNDDVEELLLDVMESVTIPRSAGVVKERNLQQSVSTVLEALDKTINRTTITYNLWLSQVKS